MKKTLNVKYFVNYFYNIIREILLEKFVAEINWKQNFSWLYVPAPPERPPERELNGAIFEVSAFVKPAEAPENNVVALFISGPILPVALWIFWDIKSLTNFDEADVLGSIPKAAFFALLDSSRTASAFVFASRNPSIFWRNIKVLKKINSNACAISNILYALKKQKKLLLEDVISLSAVSSVFLHEVLIHFLCNKNSRDFIKNIAFQFLHQIQSWGCHFWFQPWRQPYQSFSCPYQLFRHQPLHLYRLQWRKPIVINKLF